MNDAPAQPMSSTPSMLTLPHRPRTSKATLPSQIACSASSTTEASVTEPSSPYRSLWLETSARLLTHAQKNIRLIRRDLPAEHASHTSKNGRFKIQAKAWILLQQGQPTTEFRIVLIEGSANTILNTWAFPFSASHLPVFAAELIAMAGLPRLTFMDIQVPSLSEIQIQKTRERTREIRREFTDLVCEELPPAWAIDASGGDYLFRRSSDATTFPRIQNAYLALLDAYLAQTTEHTHIPRNQARDLQSRETLSAYQQHHMQHSPGRMFLGKVFGEYWTDDFLTNFLFTLPGA